MGLIRKYPIAASGAALSLLLFPLQIALDLDIFEYLSETFIKFHYKSEHYELDEILISTFVLLGFLLVQAFASWFRRAQAERVREEKLKTMRSTMYTVKDLVFNSFNAFELVILEAEQKGVDKKTLAEFETSMRETVRKINAIIELDEARDRQLGGSISVIDTSNR